MRKMERDLKIDMEGKWKLWFALGFVFYQVLVFVRGM